MNLFRTLAVAFAALSLSIALEPAASFAAQGDPPVRVRMTEEGPAFTTLDGMTLYVWSREANPPGKVQCTDKRHTTYKAPPTVQPVPAPAARKSCTDKWPPLFAEADAKPEGPWSLITRDDGRKQWVYEGLPVYRSVKDKRPGDTNGVSGQGWSPALAPVGLPPGIKLLRRKEGLVLATVQDRLLFRSKSGHRACDRCGSQLSPLNAPAVTSGSNDWSVIDTGAGQPQYTYKGQPLFTAPDGVLDADVLAGGTWDLALYKKAAPVPREIKTTMTLAGEVYTDQDGRVLYWYDCNHGDDALPCNDPGDAAAYYAQLCGNGDQCAQQWRPVLASRASRAAGQWTIEDIAHPWFSDPAGVTYGPELPRVRAWAYQGRPVFTFADDEPGEIRGHGVRSRTVSGFWAVPVPGGADG